MAGGTFALVERSLRVDSRSLRTHIVRLLFVGGLLAVLIFIQSESRSMSNPGGYFFSGICSVNLILLNLAAMSFFSTIITEEKEEMTLGLLKMAGISGLGILTGKLAPRLISVIMLLSIQVPFTFLAITLGGLSTEQVLAAYVALISFTIFVAGIGMLLSTICPRSTLSTALMTGLLAAFYLVPLVGRAMTFPMSRRGSAGFWLKLVSKSCDALLSLSPIESMMRILSTGYSGGIVTAQFFIHIGIGIGAVGLSWMLFDRCTRNEKPIAPSRGLGGIALAFRSKRQLHQRRVWRNALAWKDFHFTTGGTTALIIKFICYAGLMIVLTLMVGRNFAGNMRNALGDLCWVSMVLALAIEVPIYLSRVFREEVRWQTWPGLVLLPESVATIARNKLIGILPTFLPALTIMSIGVLLNPRNFFEFVEGVLTHAAGYYAISQYVLLLHLSVLLSLSVKWGSLPLSIAIVVLLNILVGICLTSARGGQNAVIIPTFLSFVVCIVMFFFILHRLRTVAAK
jgi:hypothetical protein